MKQKKYIPKLDVKQTQSAIDYIKTNFQIILKKELKLDRVSAPLFLQSNGFNDYLSNNEQPVSFFVPRLNKNLEVVQSLAKWKRLALKKYNYDVYTGIFTDMNAIRPNDEIDAIHSIYVDQWDWEYVINKSDCNLDFLFNFIKNFYQMLVVIEKFTNVTYKQLENKLPEDIFIISTKELYDMYPEFSAKEREYKIVKKHKAVFLYQIGDIIPGTQEIHDLRAKDYDNWKLNGDLIVYHAINDCALELMSMGIRVDKQSLIEQNKLNLNDFDSFNDYWKMIINEELPQTIGGGIGQSRLCMFLLEKKHIGEVQVSVWDEDEILKLNEENIEIL